MPNYDEKTLHYGFQIGIYQSGMSLRYNKNTRDTITVARKPGFSLGFITNFRLKDDFWALRILPNVSFYDRTIAYKASGGATRVPQSFEATVVEIPILIKYKSRRRKNHRMYMIGGLTPGIEVGGKSSISEEGLRFQRNNLEISYGMGFDLYWNFFKFAPEVRFSHGIPNLLKHTNNIYGQQLDRVTTHKVCFYFNFE